MLKIGEFSKFTCISVRMLRHYDEIGLLVPEKIDIKNGYRYYTFNQLTLANNIQSLKQMGFGISYIKEMLINDNNLETVKKYMNIKYLELKDEKENIENKLKMLENSLLILNTGKMKREYNVVIKEFKEMNLVYYRDIVPTYDEMGRMWDNLELAVINMNIKLTNPSYPLAIFNDRGYKESDVDISVCLSVVEKCMDKCEVKFKTFPSTTAATVIFKGNYHQIKDVSKSIGMWISKNSYELSAPNFIIYHVSPHDTNNPDEYVTEVCFPIKSDFHKYAE